MAKEASATMRELERELGDTSRTLEARDRGLAGVKITPWGEDMGHEKRVASGCWFGATSLRDQGWGVSVIVSSLN